MVADQLKLLGSGAAKLDELSKQLTAMAGKPPTASEGFQSGGNPYNMLPPSLYQAYEFKLGKKAVTDSVLGFMNV
jgi:hypothetical protein